MTLIASEAEMLHNSGAWDALLDAIISRPRRNSERKQDRSRRTERQILTGALRIFARDGISRAKIADVAAEAGISTSTFYEYFKSKEDLAYDLPMVYLADYFQLYRDACSPGMSARERLHLYLTMSADYAREHAEWARLLYLEIWPSVFVTETDMRHSIDDYAKVVRALVAEGKAEGWVANDRNDYETTALIMGGLNQSIITWLLFRKPRNLTKSGNDFADRVINMLELEAAATR